MALAGIKVAVLVIVITGIVFCEPVHCHGGLVSRGSRSWFWDLLEFFSFGFFRAEYHSDGSTSYRAGGNVPIVGLVEVGVDVGKDGGIKPHVDIDVDIGVAKARINVHFDKKGINVGIGGKVNLIAELEGDIEVRSDRTVAAKAGVGVNLGHIAKAKVNVVGDTNGSFRVQASAHADIYVAELSAHASIDQDLEISSGITGGIQIGPNNADKKLLTESKDD